MKPSFKRTEKEKIFRTLKKLKSFKFWGIYDIIVVIQRYLVVLPSRLVPYKRRQRLVGFSRAGLVVVLPVGRHYPLRGPEASCLFLCAGTSYVTSQGGRDHSIFDRFFFSSIISLVPLISQHHLTTSGVRHLTTEPSVLQNFEIVTSR